jgi:hypothetical protein
MYPAAEPDALEDIVPVDVVVQIDVGSKEDKEE